MSKPVSDTETEISLFGRNRRHWLCRKFSFWQIKADPVRNICQDDDISISVNKCKWPLITILIEREWLIFSYISTHAISLNLHEYSGCLRLIHSQISTAAPLKFENGYVISPMVYWACVYLSMPDRRLRSTVTNIALLPIFQSNIGILIHKYTISPFRD